MPVSAPREPVYYYEASNGKFRLTYFVPPEKLQQLSEENEISEQALVDFPDGVDLSCTEPDFQDFEDLYGYRPQLDPDALCRAFFTILTSTHNWQTFRGSGLIPAADLEGLVETVEDAVQQEQVIDEPIPFGLEEPTLEQRRRQWNQQATQQMRVQDRLEQMDVEWVDSGQTLGNQQFSAIEMQEGDSAEDVFTEIHRKQRGK